MCLIINENKPRLFNKAVQSNTQYYKYVIPISHGFTKKISNMDILGIYLNGLSYQMHVHKEALTFDMLKGEQEIQNICHTLKNVKISGNEFRNTK